MILPFSGSASRGGGPIEIGGGETAAYRGLRVAFSGLLANEIEWRRDLPDAPAGAAGIVAALAAHAPGDGWVERIWGEYAIAVADDRTGEVTLVRDRIGVHPLFVARDGDRLLFATEARALLARPGVVARPHLPTVARLAGTHYRHVEDDRRATAFEGIERLPAATALRFGPSGTAERSYWGPPADPPDLPRDEDEAVEALRALLDDAVARRLRDVDAGTAAFTLSSGMDSSTVLGLARRRLDAPPRAVSTVFPGWSFDEGPEIEPTARALGRWTPVAIAPFDDLLEAAAGLQADHDEPVVTVTWLWDRLAHAEAARLGARVLFGGLGGDEAFAGEFEHFFFHFADLDAAGARAELDREVAAWIRIHDHPVHRKSWDLVHETWRRMRGEGGRVRPDAERHGRYLGALSPAARAAAAAPRETENPYPSYLRNRLWQDLRFETTLPCLRAAFANAAAAGTEVRYPLLDHRVQELALALPGGWKFRGGVTKTVLRRAMRGIVPDASVDRARKVGWSAPVDLWLRGAASDSVASLPDSPAWRTRDLYAAAEVRRLVAEHRAGAADHSMFLWQAAALEAWWRRWFG